MPQANTIKEVLDQLDDIINQSIAENSNLGLFAYVYRRTTAEIADAIANKRFEDNERMERFDVVFANFYLDAYHAFQNNQNLSKSWRHVFEASSEYLSILQHVIMGMNVHINLDLAISAANVMDGKDIQAIEKDYHLVNDILFEITNELQARISRVSPLMFLADWMGKNSDERIIDFSMQKARTAAWNAANLIWSLQGTDRDKAIEALDSTVLMLGNRLQKPRFIPIKWIFDFIQRFENKKVGEVIAHLRE